MPRPRKWRNVCCLPDTDRFGPLNGRASTEKRIQMTVDEYESIRLIDLEGMNQEECARHMNIARTTVQGIYLEARRKLAQALVEGCVLYITGGDYQLCDGQNSCCRKGGCQKKQMRHGCCSVISDGVEAEQRVNNPAETEGTGRNVRVEIQEKKM